MITIIHAADLHLDSPFSGLSPEQAARRRGEQRLLLEDLTALARREGADAVLLAGDLFDGQCVYSQTTRALARALGEMPWTSAELEQLRYQFNNLASIPNYPGSYIIGRYTSFAFLAAYNDGADPVSKLLSYIPTINKEITRKRAEFGLETLEPGQTLAEKRAAEAAAAGNAE